MKIGNLLISVLIGYFVIGGLLGLTQLGLSKLFEPPCQGTVVHRLWEGFPKPISDYEALQGKKDEPFISGLVRGMAQWLPDLYREVITGDMAAGDYLLGGYQCVPAKPLQTSLGYLLGGQFYLPGSATQRLDITKGLPPKQGSLAVDVIKGREGTGQATDPSLVTIEPIAGVTLELPIDWLEVDPTAIQQQMAERNQTWGMPEVPQIHTFVPPNQADDLVIQVGSYPPVLPGKELQNLHEPQILEFMNGMIEGHREEAGKNGFTVLAPIDLSEERAGTLAGFGFTVQMTSPSGTVFETRYTIIQSQKRTVILGLTGSKTLPSKSGEILKHARESLKITS